MKSELEERFQENVERLRLLEERAALRRGLPHIYSFKWYDWARSYYESTNKFHLLCAANQISKSSTQIRKLIDWATDRDKWEELWPGLTPNLFWYFYPSGEITNTEFETKWKQFLPTGEFKDSERYGWEVITKKGDIKGIKFNSGILLEFKSYSQKVSNLQAGTVYAIWLDEELPMELYSEVTNRLNSTDGYFHMVFTATLGQDFWRRALEPERHEKEELIGAWKRQISIYECMKYEDGSLSHWTEERIDRIIAKCKSAAEVLRRVYGKFVLDSGRKYGKFDIKKHYKPGGPVPHDWLIYVGVDLGSGGKDGHPSAIVWIAVDPTMRRARVIAGWRGDNIQTTAQDVLDKYLEMRKELELSPLQIWYDYAAKDFGTISNSAGIPFERAEKSHAIGEEVLNTLFGNDMLIIDSDKGDELHKLAMEFASLKQSTPKTKAKDDFVDGCRYGTAKIPFDWSFITGRKPDQKEKEEQIPTDPMQLEVYERRKSFINGVGKARDSIEAEINEINELLDI